MVPGRRSLFVLAVTAMVVLVLGAPALAIEFTTPLRTGDVSIEVRALENRIAGWFPKPDQTVFLIDQRFDDQTRWAVARFQRHYGLEADGVAGRDVFEVLDRLEQKDRSTLNFDFSEFWQNRNPDCSRRANRYEGTFEGGMVPAPVVKRNVVKLMWRLEAIRARGGDAPIAINSGFRSVAYNDCLGGASLSQHMFGTAVDTKMIGVDNRKQRDLARSGQLHGIGCYSSLSHNHLDLRIQNRALPATADWWWPRQDRYDRDLADDGRPCHGEDRADSSTGRMAAPSAADAEAWEAAGELPLNGAD